MTALQSFAPVSGNGKSDSQQQDAPQPRTNAQALRDASQYLNRIADDFDEGRLDHHPVVEDHEETCREIEAIASGGEVEPDSVETMDIEKQFDENRQELFRNPKTVFKGAIIEVIPQQIRGISFAPKGPNTNLAVDASNIPSFHAARQVAIAMNRESIKRGRISRAVVIWQRGGKHGKKFAAMKLPTGIPVKNCNNPVQDHPAIRFEELELGIATAEVSRLNKTAKKKNGRQVRWHIIVVPICSMTE